MPLLASTSKPLNAGSEMNLTASFVIIII